jgi:hypothetical protein
MADSQLQQQHQLHHFFYGMPPPFLIRHHRRTFAKRILILKNLTTKCPLGRIFRIKPPVRFSALYALRRWLEPLASNTKSADAAATAAAMFHPPPPPHLGIRLTTEDWRPLAGDYG